MLTPVAWKGTDGTLHKMRQAEIRFQEGATQSEDDAERGSGTSSELDLFEIRLGDLTKSFYGLQQRGPLKGA